MITSLLIVSALSSLNIVSEFERAAGHLSTVISERIDKIRLRTVFMFILKDDDLFWKII